MQRQFNNTSTSVIEALTDQYIARHGSAEVVAQERFFHWGHVFKILITLLYF